MKRICIKDSCIIQWWFTKGNNYNNNNNNSNDRLALPLRRSQDESNIPEWIMKGKTTLIQKDPQKGTIPSNYRLTMYLHIMWKILIAQIKEVIYTCMPQIVSQRAERIPQGKRNRGSIVHWSAHRQGEQREAEKCTSGVDWLQNILWCGSAKLDNRLSKNIRDIIKFITETKKNWKVELTAEGKTLAEVKTQRGIFQRNMLLPLLFVITMKPLNHIENVLGAANLINCKKRLITNGWHQAICKKWKRIKDSNTNKKNILSRYRNWI